MNKFTKISAATLLAVSIGFGHANAKIYASGRSDAARNADNAGGFGADQRSTGSAPANGRNFANDVLHAGLCFGGALSGFAQTYAAQINDFKALNLNPFSFSREWISLFSNRRFRL